MLDQLCNYTKLNLCVNIQCWVSYRIFWLVIEYLAGTVKNYITYEILLIYRVTKLQKVPFWISVSLEYISIK